MMYVVEMKINGQWVFLGQSADKTDAEIALKGASMNGECRIREIDETATKEVEAETEETAEHNANDFTLKNQITGKHLTIEEYYNNLYESFADEFFGKKVTLDDIESWCDYDAGWTPCLNYEDIEDDTSEWEECSNLCYKLREKYITKCKLAFNVK